MFSHSTPFLPSPAGDPAKPRTYRNGDFMLNRFGLGIERALSCAGAGRPKSGEPGGIASDATVGSALSVWTWGRSGLLCLVGLLLGAPIGEEGSWLNILRALLASDSRWIGLACGRPGRRAGGR